MDNVEYGAVPKDDAAHSPDHEHFSNRAPWLRAAVLGANDGLVSICSILVGVSSGGASQYQVFLAGLSGLIGGTCSMALGEYVSVWSQKDAELADIEKERIAQSTEHSRKKEFEELKQIYISRGLSETLAYEVAKQLTDRDVIRAHARDELGIDIDDLANPIQAASISAFSFSLGGSFPMIGILFSDGDEQKAIKIVIVICAIGLATCGAIGNYLGGANVMKGSARVFVGGLLALAATYIAGYLFEKELG